MEESTIFKAGLIFMLYDSIYQRATTCRKKGQMTTKEIFEYWDAVDNLNHKVIKMMEPILN